MKTQIDEKGNGGSNVINLFTGQALEDVAPRAPAGACGVYLGLGVVAKVDAAGTKLWRTWLRPRFGRVPVAEGCELVEGAVYVLLHYSISVYSEGGYAVLVLDEQSGREVGFRRLTHRPDTEESVYDLFESSVGLDGSVIDLSTSEFMGSAI